MTEISLDRLRAAVSAVVRDAPEVVAVYAYGSRTSGRPLPHSDLDLAFVLGAGSPPPDPLLAERLSALIAVELRTRIEIDGHLAEHLPLPVRGRVVTTGVLLFERDPVRRVGFETATEGSTSTSSPSSSGTPGICDLQSAIAYLQSSSSSPSCRRSRTP